MSEFYTNDIDEYHARIAGLVIPPDKTAIGWENGKLWIKNPQPEWTLGDQAFEQIAVAEGVTITSILPDGELAGTYVGLRAIAEVTLKAIVNRRAGKEHSPPIIKLTFDCPVDDVPNRLIYRQTKICYHKDHSHWERVD